MAPTTTSTGSNPWFGLSMALVGVIAGYGIAMATGAAMPAMGGSPSQVANNPAPTPTPTPTPAPTPAAPEAGDYVPVSDEDYIFGDPDAQITVIEYSDFECPFCGRHHPTMKQLVENNDNVNWVYRHFPLSFHPNAQRAAEASECAGELGGNDAFWAYGDILFDQGPAGDLVAYAGELGLDTTEFETCLDEGRYTQKVKDQMAGGSAGGVSGTPGNIIINNDTGDTRLVSGAQPLANFESAIEALTQ